MRAPSDYLVQERQILLEKCKTFLDVGNLYLTPSSRWMFCGFLSAINRVQNVLKHTSGNRWSWNKSPLGRSSRFHLRSRRDITASVCVRVCVRVHVCVCRCMLCGKMLMLWWTQKYHWSLVPSIVTTWCSPFDWMGRWQQSDQRTSTCNPESTPLYTYSPFCSPWENILPFRIPPWHWNTNAISRNSPIMCTRRHPPLSLEGRCCAGYLTPSQRAYW